MKTNINLKAYRRCGRSWTVTSPAYPYNPEPMQRREAIRLLNRILRTCDEATIKHIPRIAASKSPNEK